MNATPVRFPIRISPVWQPFMLFLGATAANCYVELHGDDVHLRFGPTFSHTIQRSNVISASPISWSIFDGLGVRAGGRVVGLIGALGDVVELQTRESVPIRFAGFPWTVRRIAISMQEPEAFIAAIAA